MNPLFFEHIYESFEDVGVIVIVERVSRSRIEVEVIHSEGLRSWSLKHTAGIKLFLYERTEECSTSASKTDFNNYKHLAR